MKILVHKSHDETGHIYSFKIPPSFSHFAAATIHHYQNTALASDSVLVAFAQIENQWRWKELASTMLATGSIFMLLRTNCKSTAFDGIGEHSAGI